MHLLDLTLDTPAGNLALDEALLETAEAGQGPEQVLRLWESSATAVIVGRSSRVEEEVDRAECARRNISVLRRTSGGAAVVIGPGCLMYSVVLSCREHSPLRMIDEAHRHVLEVAARAVGTLLPDVVPAGTSDLAIGGRKFSGNSLRLKRDHLLYHGTLLYAFPLDVIAACLRSPPRQPEYRAGRGHGEFVMNLPVDGEKLRSALIEAWGADQSLVDWPASLAQRLTAERYTRDAWNFQR